jgi:hypothetical protein
MDVKGVADASYDEKQFLANPVYAREYPPAKYLE